MAPQVTLIGSELPRSFVATASELQEWASMQTAIDEIAAQFQVTFDMNIMPVWTRKSSRSN